MSESSTGVDRRDRGICLAVTGTDSGRLTIRSLHLENGAEEVRSRLPESGPVTLAVPEPEAQIKTVRVSPGDPDTREERLRFELLASMLDPESSFLTAIELSRRDDRHLGMILRTERARALCKSVGCSYETGRERLGFHLRAVGLGRGYLTFCKREGSELVGLVDLTSTLASICLVHEDDIVEATSLVTAPLDLGRPADRERFAVDLKTILNFSLARLIDAGISVPLSRLLIIGESVDAEFLGIVNEYFPAGVGTPQVHEGFLASLEPDLAESAPLFLVALGLAVN